MANMSRIRTTKSLMLCEGIRPKQVVTMKILRRGVHLLNTPYLYCRLLIYDKYYVNIY